MCSSLQTETMVIFKYQISLSLAIEKRKRFPPSSLKAASTFQIVHSSSFGQSVAREERNVTRSQEVNKKSLEYAILKQCMKTFKELAKVESDSELNFR